MVAQKLCGAILTALLISGCTKRDPGTVEALKVNCSNNLKTLYTFGMLYGDRKDRYFPHSPDGSIASLQLLVDYYPQDFNPEIFICRSDAETQAATDVKGELVLRPENCSYETVPWKLKITERNAIWLYDKAQHHTRGRNVTSTDGSVRFMDEETFQKRMSEDRKRFGASE